MSDDDRPIRSSLAGVCPLCGTVLDLNSTACRRCGVTPKRVGLCVHCNSTSSVRPDPALGWVCEVCGGARLAHPAFEADNTVHAPLAAATHHHRTARLMRAGSVASAAATGFSLFVLLITRALFSMGNVTLAMMALAPLLFVVIALISFARAKSLRSRTALDLEQAQTAALVKLLADYPEGALASQLASSLQISHPRAEQLLTRLNVHDDIQSVITDDGQLLFRIRSSDDALNDPLGARAPSRLRVAADDANGLQSDERNASAASDGAIDAQRRAERPSTEKAR